MLIFPKIGRIMAFPPLVSSTPPPLDNFGESDEDEFGDFTTGGIDGTCIQINSYLIKYQTILHVNVSKL